MMRAGFTSIAAFAFTSATALKSATHAEAGLQSLHNKAASLVLKAVEQHSQQKQGPNLFGGSTFDCAKYPNLCQAPFNCQEFSAPRAMGAWMVKGLAGITNKSSPRAWCISPSYEQYATECLVEKDLVKAGKNQYANTEKGKFGGAVSELDGSYCFIDGHCTNAEVTKDTTLAEADAMCDRKYTHNTWTSFGSVFQPTSNLLLNTIKSISTSPGGGMNGFSGQNDTRPFVLAACAMGNYHCDVMYCKETYCKKEYFVKKYGHFLKDLGHDDGSFVKNFLANLAAENTTATAM